MLIFLVGYMGCGKTTIGKLLADALKCRFIDTDDLLEAREQKTCSELMQACGEKYFREAEKEILHNVVATETTAVIATGGGMPCFLDNMDFMNDRGRTVFLDWTVENLAIRLELTDLSLRPMLRGKTKLELREHIKKQLETRMPFYGNAHYIITCNGLDDNAIVNKVLLSIAH